MECELLAQEQRLHGGGRARRLHDARHGQPLDSEAAGPRVGAEVRRLVLKHDEVEGFTHHSRHL